MPRRGSQLCSFALAVWACAVAGTLRAQVTRLPVTDPETKLYDHGILPPIDQFLGESPQAQWPETNSDEPIDDYRRDEPNYPGVLTTYPDSTAELPQRPLDVPPVDLKTEQKLPPGARQGMFQKATFTGAWLAPGGEDGFGISTLESKLVLAAPFPLEGSYLIMTPGFAVHYLDGPRGRDMPPQLFDSYTQFRVMWPAAERLGIDLAVTPGVYSDFQQDSDEALRVSWHAAAMFEWRPTVKIVAGAAYAARETTGVLPIGGIVWTPSEEWRLEILFPQPKLARRLYWSGRLAPGIEQWVYLSGEWGGGSWAIERTGGPADVVTLTDLRLILGWERTNVEGLNALLEIGYVCDRKIEYKRRRTPDFEPADTLMLRGALTY